MDSSLLVTCCLVFGQYISFVLGLSFSLLLVHALPLFLDIAETASTRRCDVRTTIAADCAAGSRLASTNVADSASASREGGIRLSTSRFGNQAILQVVLGLFFGDALSGVTRR